MVNSGKSVRNDYFRVALDYLYKQGRIVDQRELSEKTGLSQKSISQILNNRVKKPSEATIRKLNEAFGNIFNPAYFRGESPYLIAQDAEYQEQNPGQNISSSRYAPIDEQSEQVAEPQQDYQAIPAWADTLMSIIAEQIQKNEALNRELRQSIAEVNALRDDLSRIIHGRCPTIPPANNPKSNH
jgi:transcriptional regulator with XRE-family HTH domain